MTTAIDRPQARAVRRTPAAAARVAARVRLVAPAKLAVRARAEALATAAAPEQPVTRERAASPAKRAAQALLPQRAAVATAIRQHRGHAWIDLRICRVLRARACHVSYFHQAFRAESSELFLIHSFRFLSFLLVLAPMLAGCGDDDPALDSGPREPEPLTIDFALHVNGEDFACGETYSGVGSPSADFRATDARFYVYGVELVDEKGTTHPFELDDDSAFQGAGVALLDFEDGCGSDGTEETNTQLRGSVVPAAYESIRFTLGVPPEQNFLDLATAAPPLDVTGMYWSWLAGYKFLKLDGSTPMEGGGIHPFLLHLGSAGCPGDNSEAAPLGPCAFPNRVNVELSGFTRKDTKVVADLADVFANSDLSLNTSGTAPGCMSEPGDPECETVLPRLGVNGADEQHLFHVE
jgi:uncharacterized repeat protein (TIGR04052 family)